MLLGLHFRLFAIVSNAVLVTGAEQEVMAVLVCALLSIELKLHFCSPLLYN